jgi:hypothetical protein
VQGKARPVSIVVSAMVGPSGTNKQNHNFDAISLLGRRLVCSRASLKVAVPPDQYVSGGGTHLFCLRIDDALETQRT